MKRPKYKNLFKLTLLINALCVMIISFMLINRMIDTRHYMIDSQTGRLETVNRLAAASMQDYFGKIKMSLNTADFWLEANKEADPRFDNDFRKLIELLELNMSENVDFRLVSKEGGLFYIPSESKEPLADVSDRQYYLVQQKKETQGIFIGDPVKSRVTKKWGIPISHPIKSENGGMSVIFGALEIPTFDRIFKYFQMEQGGTILLVRSDGVILANAPFDENMIGKSISSKEFWNRVVLDQKPGRYFYETDEIDGVDRFVVSNAVEGVPIYLISTCEKSEVLKPWNEILMQTMISITLLIITFVLLGKLILNLTRRLEMALGDLVLISNTDYLTGMYNRRQFLERFDQEQNRIQRYGGNFAFAEMDIDYFKDINDNYGHDIGDEVLRKLAILMKAHIRENDVVARWGGEEFVFLLIGADKVQAITCIEKLRNLIKETDFGLGEHITCSFGVTLCRPEETFITIMNRADKLLYRAKSEGRDRVVADE